MSDARDLVVGSDSSTQSIRAIAWTRDGAPVAEGRAAVAIANRDLRQPDHRQTGRAHAVDIYLSNVFQGGRSAPKVTKMAALDERAAQPAADA